MCSVHRTLSSYSYSERRAVPTGSWDSGFHRTPLLQQDASLPEECGPWLSKDTGHMTFSSGLYQRTTLGGRNPTGHPGRHHIKLCCLPRHPPIHRDRERACGPLLSVCPNHVFTVFHSSRDACLGLNPSSSPSPARWPQVSNMSRLHFPHLQNGNSST